MTATSCGKHCRSQGNGNIVALHVLSINLVMCKNVYENSSYYKQIESMNKFDLHSMTKRQSHKNIIRNSHKKCQK